MASDRELVALAQSGDGGAFGELWRRHEPGVTAYCRSFLGHSPVDPSVDYDDLSTETFVRAIHGLRRFDNDAAHPGTFQSWLTAVAHRTCLKHVTRAAHRRHLVQVSRGAGWSPEAPRETDLLAEVQRRALLRAAAEEVSRLPAHYRSAFEMHLEDCSQVEIGRSLGVAPENAAKRVQRARSMLRRAMASWLASPEHASLRPAAARELERQLGEAVRDFRIVDITVRDGGQMQVCLRASRELLEREPELERRRSELLSGRASAADWWRHAELCYHCGRWVEAEEACRMTLDADRDCAPASLRLAALLAMQGRTDQASQVCAEAAQRQVGPAMLLRLRGEHALFDARFREAVRLLEEAVALDPSDRQLYWSLDKALAASSQYERQLANLERLRRLAPADVRAYVAAYTPCARLARFREAGKLMARAVRLDPNYPPAVKHLLQVRMNSGPVDAETLDLAERLTRLAPDLADSWQELSGVYQRMGRYDEAVAIMRAFVELHPRNAEGRSALAWRLQGVRPTEAATEARTAYALQPDNWYVAWTALAILANEADADRVSEADAAADAMTVRFRADAFMMENLAHYYRTRGVRDAAVHCALRAVRLSRGSPPARVELAEVSLAFGEPRMGVRALRDAEKMPTFVRIAALALRGRLRLATADPGAPSDFRLAYRLARLPVEFLTVGRTCAVAGESVLARKALRRVITTEPPPSQRGRAAAEMLASL
jgi:RNA polymerase sigma factor (sigma-70 family)